jgi:hypothetical protein
MSSQGVEELKGTAAGSGDVNTSGSGATGSQKKTEKRTPKKLGQKKQPQQEPTPEATPDPDGEADEEADGDAGVGAEAEQYPEPEPERAVSKRRQSRGRGRRGVLDSDTESIARSDVSAAGGGRRNRQRRQKTQQKQSGGPLDGIAEGLPGGELVSGATDLVQNTAGNAVGQVGNTVGGLTKGLTGGGEEEDSKSEQLRLRLELNLDIEVQLKAKIHGDLTLGLLYVSYICYGIAYTNNRTGTRLSADCASRFVFNVNIISDGACGVTGISQCTYSPRNADMPTKTSKSSHLT